MSWGELWGCKGMFPYNGNKRTSVHSWAQTISQCHYRHFPFHTLLRSLQLCSIQMFLNASWPLCHRSKWAIIFETLSVILYLLHSLVFPSSLLRSAAVKREAKKRLPYNSRCRGWGPHLGDIASLILHCSWARSFLLYPLLWRVPKKENTVPALDCQECLIILLGHKKDFGVSGSKCVSLKGLEVISVSFADAPKGSGLRL